MTANLFPNSAPPSIGLGIGIPDVSEFNRRALIALRGVNFGENNRSADIVTSCRSRVDGGRELTDKQQQALINICHRYRRQISDEAVAEFAAARAKGSD